MNLFKGLLSHVLVALLGVSKGLKMQTKRKFLCLNFSCIFPFIITTSNLLAHTQSRVLAVMVLSFQAMTRGAAGGLNSPLGSDRPAIVCLAPEQELRSAFWSSCIKVSDHFSCNAKVLQENTRVFFSAPPSRLFLSPLSPQGLRRLVITELIHLWWQLPQLSCHPSFYLLLVPAQEHWKETLRWFMGVGHTILAKH